MDQWHHTVGSESFYIDSLVEPCFERKQMGFIACNVLKLFNLLIFRKKAFAYSFAFSLGSFRINSLKKKLYRYEQMDFIVWKAGGYWLTLSETKPRLVDSTNNFMLKWIHRLSFILLPQKRKMTLSLSNLSFSSSSFCIYWEKLHFDAAFFPVSQKSQRRQTNIRAVFFRFLILS